jgi:retron-type reverse transcriptase
MLPSPNMPPFFDPHACRPPPTANLLHLDRMAWVCECGRRWWLEWFLSADGVQRLGPSWILSEHLEGVTLNKAEP